MQPPKSLRSRFTLTFHTHKRSENLNQTSSWLTRFILNCVSYSQWPVNDTFHHTCDSAPEHILFSKFMLWCRGRLTVDFNRQNATVFFFNIVVTTQSFFSTMQQQKKKKKNNHCLKNICFPFVKAELVAMKADATSLLPFRLECTVEKAWMFLVIGCLNFYLTGEGGNSLYPPRKNIRCQILKCWKEISWVPHSKKKKKEKKPEPKQTSRWDFSADSCCNSLALFALGHVGAWRHAREMQVIRRAPGG